MHQSNLDERHLALQYSKVVSEWEGNPFRVDMIRNFPSFVSDDDLWDLLRPVDRLADQIEEQLGYRIVETGNVIDTPAGAAPDWNANFNQYWQYDSDNALLPREKGQLLVFYMNDDNPVPWDAQGGGSPLNAHICCGTISYNKRAMGDWWHGKDSACSGEFAANGRDGESLVHELFHLFGFRHPDDPPERGVPMCEGALHNPWKIGACIHSASPNDIDRLQRVFPKGA